MRLWPAHPGLGLDSPGRDTFIVTLGNAITSILAGFAIFSVLGYMSQELGVPVDQVAKAGMWRQHMRVGLGPRVCCQHRLARWEIASYVLGCVCVRVAHAPVHTYTCVGHECKYMVVQMSVQ